MAPHQTPAPDSDAPTQVASPSRARQRRPALFAPTPHQLQRLHELLRSDSAVGDALAAAMRFGVPIGPTRPAVLARQVAQHARALRRTLSALHDLIRDDSPAWSALVDQAAAEGPDSPVAPLLHALSTGALPELIERTSALASPVHGQRGRPADPDRDRRQALVRELAQIADAAGLHIGRLAPDFYELLEIVFDLAYITGPGVDRAVRDLLDSRQPGQPQGRVVRHLF